MSYSLGARCRHGFLRIEVVVAEVEMGMRITALSYSASPGSGIAPGYGSACGYCNPVPAPLSSHCGCSGVGRGGAYWWDRDSEYRGEDEKGKCNFPSGSTVLGGGCRGTRRATLPAVPMETADHLDVHGPDEGCREKVSASEGKFPDVQHERQCHQIDAKPPCSP